MRKTRKDLVEEDEGRAQRRRDHEYAELKKELDGWDEGQSDSQPGE